MTSNPETLQVQSTRLFPKNLGADAYKIDGIAAKCDWVMLTDRQTPRVHLVQNRVTETPRHIFVSMRDHRRALTSFVAKILPRLKSDFVLITGSEDATVPRQIDKRWQVGSEECPPPAKSILTHPNLLHWFAENLDTNSFKKLSAMPLGMVFPKGYPAEGFKLPPYRPLSQKKLRVLCGHRTREGDQWVQRRRVSRIASTKWADWCTVLDASVPFEHFVSFIDTHSFVLCVEGGGLDPSPKAWQTLLQGSIPIVRRNPTSLAYSDLPVFFVDKWHEDCLNYDRLKRFRDIVEERQNQEPNFREDLFFKLSQDFWWGKVEKKLRSKDQLVENNSK